MATGIARGAAARGKRIAFGDGERICWDKWSPQVFKGNPNIAAPGSEGADDIEWNAYRKGNRIYNTHDPVKGCWVWNLAFRAIPGEMFFDEDEVRWAEQHGSDFIVIEPNLPPHKPSSRNKQWPIDRYEQVTRYFRSLGHDVVQFKHIPSYSLGAARIVKPPSFRLALAVMARAKLYIGPEGGLHHGAAAVGVRGVVLFGGFIPPQVTGYDMHTNLTGGATACGSLRRCHHCKNAMRAISVDHVIAAAKEQLEKLDGRS